MTTYLRVSVLGIIAASTLLTALGHAQPAPPPAAQPPSAAPPPNAPGAAPAPAEAPPGSVPVAPGPSGPPPSAGTNPFYEQAPPQQQPATIHVAQPPPPPLEPRTRLYHDGFYLRLSTGFGYQGASSSVGDSHVSTHGAGFALDIMMGGTPATGVVVGGGLLFQTAVSPGQTIEGPPFPGLEAYPGGGVGLGLLGPFIDVFPNPTGGFHLGAELGLAGLGLKGNDDKLSAGGGGSIWVGYMDWMSSQWSLGGLIRGTAVGTKRQVGAAATDVSDGAWGFTAEYSALYH
jgi:hypothetical protein